MFIIANLLIDSHILGLYLCGNDLGHNCHIFCGSNFRLEPVCFWGNIYYVSLTHIRLNNPFLQAYFLGCSFDTWSHEFWDQMYVYTLMVLGYFIPLIIICMSYLKIFWFTRQSRQCVLNHMRQIQSQLLDTTKNEQEHESSFMEATFSGNRQGTTGHNLLCSDQYAEEFLRKTLEVWAL